jgi:FLVCR family feline leukemia virus subgroup C receptor-related protein
MASPAASKQESFLPQVDSARGAPIAAGMEGVRIESSSRRIAVLLIYCCYGLGNQFQFVSNANIVKPLTQFIDCSAFEINLLAAIFSLVYILGCFPACEVFARWGLRFSLLMGLSCNFIGATLKFIAILWCRHFWLVFIGQTVAAFGQIFFLALPPLLAATWFPTSERSLATALGTLSGFLGMAIGFSVPPAMVSVGDPPSKFEGLFGLQFGYCLANLVVCVLLVPRQPEHPPSVTSPKYAEIAKSRSAPASPQVRVSGNPAADTVALYGTPHTAAETEQAIEDALVAEAAPPHVFSQIWAQRGNKSFMILVFTFGIGGGSTNAVAAVLSQLMAPYNVSEDDSGFILMTGMICGCVACVITGPFLDKFRTYRTPLVVCYSLNVLVIGIMTVLMLTVPVNGTTFVAISYIVVIFIVILTLPTLPIGMELAVELTYPLPEAVPATACMWSNGLFSLIGTVVCSTIIGDSATKAEGVYILAVIGVMIGLCGVLCRFCIVENKKRLGAETADTLSRQASTNLSA